MGGLLQRKSYSIILPNQGKAHAAFTTIYALVLASRGIWRTTSSDHGADETKEMH